MLSSKSSRQQDSGRLQKGDKESKAEAGENWRGEGHFQIYCTLIIAGSLSYHTSHLDTRTHKRRPPVRPWMFNRGTMRRNSLRNVFGCASSQYSPICRKPVLNFIRAGTWGIDKKRVFSSSLG